MMIYTAVGEPHWMMMLLSGVILPFMMASATFVMIWLDDRRRS